MIIAPELTKEQELNRKRFLAAEEQKRRDMQEIKADAGKARLSLVPTQIMYDIAKVREYGCNKYPESGKDGWHSIERERWLDAMLRHTMQYINDPTSVDEESGLPHLWHMACNVAFLCELENNND